MKTSGVADRVASGQRRRLLQGGTAALAAVAVAPLSVLAVRPGIAQTRLPDAPDPKLSFSNPESEPAQDWMTRAGEGMVGVEGKEKDIAFEQGARRSVRAIGWTIPTNAPRGVRLLVDGRPLTARYLAWTISNVYWIAGVGWPPFVNRCPDPGLDPRMTFRNHQKFQIIPVFGGYAWRGCSASAQARGDLATEVFLWVNDFPDLYNDNAGTFDFTVTGLAL